MMTLQAYNDQLAKDKTNERNLRLKLEEEYMQNNKNHEEEVALRLKFENKFNVMHQKMRVLEQKHERTLIEVNTCYQAIKKLETENKVQLVDLSNLKANKIDLEATIERLEEYKTATEKEVKRKNNVIQRTEQIAKKTKDDSDLVKYQFVDFQKKLDDKELQISNLNNQIASLSGDKDLLALQTNEAIKQKDAFEKTYEDHKKRYVGLVDDYTATLEALKISTAKQKDLEK